MAQILAEVGITLIFTFVLALILKKFKQPALVAYLLSGLLLGPFFLNILTYRSHYELLAHLGVSTLLFIVGLQLNLTFIKNVGKIALITGIGQIVFTSFFGLLMVYWLGYSLIQSLIIALALTFSSTIIIVKLLSEKKSLDTLHGRISLGFLLVQDVVAVLVLLVLTSSVGTSGSTVVFSLFAVMGIAVAAFWIAHTFLGPLFSRLEAEMQVLLALSWCLGLAGLMQYLGLSIEIGSLLAGVSLASGGHAVQISQRLAPLRDFFLVIFFVFLGAEMFPTDIVSGSFSERMSLLGGLVGDLLTPTILLSLFVLIGNPLIVFILLTRLGYTSKTSFLSGLAVSQISEFSVIITLLARNANILSQEVVSLVTFIAIVTIVGSTYLFYRGEWLFSSMKFLKKFEKKHPLDKPHGLAGKYHKYIVFGAGAHGRRIVEKLRRKKSSYILFDTDYHVVEEMKHEGFNAEVGDAADPTLLEELNLKKSVLLISTLDDMDINVELLDVANRHRMVKFITFAQTKEDADFLLDRGAYEVIFADHLLMRQVDKTLRI